MSDYAPGKDPTLDRLGPDWKAIDGVIEGVRLFATWSETEDGRRYLSGLHVEGAAITADMLRSIPVGRLENMEAVSPRTEPFEEIIATLEPLQRSKGQNPDAFAAQVAVHYRAFAAVTSKPAKMMADRYGVPLPTMHGWIREARLRGKLPPGRRGKAG